MSERLSRIQKYQFGSNEQRTFGYPRTQYTSKIERYLGHQLVKVIIGQCRVEKSYVHRQIASNLLSQNVTHPKNILYGSREFLVFSKLKSWVGLETLYRSYRAEKAPQGKFYRFLDEIACIPAWKQTSFLVQNTP